MDSKESLNQTIARYSRFLSDYNFKVEWVPAQKMIADPFSSMMLLPAGREAMCLPEICFGKFGKRIHVDKAGGKAEDTPVLFYTPVTVMMLCDEVVEDMELVDGMNEQKLIRHCAVPVTADYFRTTGRSKGEEECFDVCAEYLEPCDTFLTNAEPNAPQLELENDQQDIKAFKPLLSKTEEIKIEALKSVRQFLTDGCLPENKVVARAVRKLGYKIQLENSKLVRLKHGGGTTKVEVLDSAERINEVLMMIHDGMEHRALASCYILFNQLFWIPATSKVISRHIAACRQC